MLPLRPRLGQNAGNSDTLPEFHFRSDHHLCFIKNRVSTSEDTPSEEKPAPAEAAPLPRLKVTPSRNQKQRSKLKQHSDEGAPAPPPPPPAPVAPEPEAPAGPPLRERRLKRSGHFELRPNQFATNEDTPPEETEY